MHILKHIKNGLRVKSKCLKVILSWEVENMLGVLLLFKLSRNFIEFIQNVMRTYIFLNKNRFSEEMF